MKLFLTLFVIFPVLLHAQNVNRKDSVYDYFHVEKKPVFPGDKNTLPMYFMNHLKYPETMDSCILTKIYFTFTIDTTGKAIKPEFNTGECVITGNYTMELIQLIDNMPDWIPGEHKGKKVKVKYSLPVFIDPNK